MTVIHYPTAFKALDHFIDKYNAAAPRKTDRLRTGAVMTAKEIIRIYGISLLKANGCQEIDRANIPSLQTNNRQLAKLVKCSSRTIQRYIIKLTTAGIITAKLFHGSNSNFELWINPQILLVKEKLAVDKVNQQLKQSLDQAKKMEVKSSALTFITPICPDTYPCNTGNKISNVIIPVDNSAGVEKKRPSLSLSQKKETGYTTGDSTGNTGEIVNSKDQSQEKNFKKYPGKNVENPVEKAGEIVSRAEPPGHRNVAPDPARDNSLNLHVSLLWLMARNLLYKNKDLTENQVMIAKKLIRQLYEPATTEQIPNFHAMYSERISLVYKYIQRDPQNRYVLLPYRYFDKRNPTGFVATKKWYKDHLQRQLEVKQELTLSRLVRKYTGNNNKDISKMKPPLQLFRECENTLGKLGGSALTDRFYAAVLHHETYNRMYVKPEKF